MPNEGTGSGGPSPAVTAAPIGPGDAGSRQMPPWLPRAVVLTLVIAILAWGAVALLGRVQGLITDLIFALFLAFALEPAVNWLTARGWRRGLATGAVLFLLLVALIALIALMLPIVFQEIEALIEGLPRLLDRVGDFTRRCCGLDLSSDSILEELQNANSALRNFANNIAGNLLGIAGAVLGGIFKLFTIGLFTFYLVADGPRIRRSICSLLRPERQRPVLFAWETAIEKTGGYFYSRLLLALINGGLFYVVLRVLGIPFALPLSIFQGLVSEFIPVVGTYIAAAVPLLVALANDPIDAAFLVVYVVIYQQVENLWLSPRISARTMDINAGIAFGAAIAGASIAGFVGAFLALPFAAVVQAFISTYARRHEVLDSELTREDPEDVESRRQEQAAREKRALTGGLVSRLWRRGAGKPPRSG